MDDSTPGQLSARLVCFEGLYPYVAQVHLCDGSDPRELRARASGVTVLAVAEVAIGLRDHSGWAVAVAVSAEPLVRDRRRMELCDPALPRQAYHAASGLPIEQAREVIMKVERSAFAASERELCGLVHDLAGQGHRVRAVAISVPTSSIPQDLSTILRSHPLLHAAEGELYSEALSDAAQAAGLPMIRFTTKDLAGAAAAALDCSPATVAEIVVELGHGLGPPWAKDQKEAAMAALLALHTAGR
jgi:hypothetical protein